MKPILHAPRARRRSLPALGLAVSAALLLGGCAAVPGGSSAPAASDSSRQPPPLKVGMSADEIRAAWGPPAEILPLENAPVTGETWRYRAVLRSAQRQVAATVEEVPFFDPISGRYIPQKEITQSQETVSQVQTTDLIMIEDQLVGWKRSLNEERTYP
jgi:hypothetical protein